MTSLLTVMDDGAGPEPEVRRAQADPGNAPGNWDDLRLNLVGLVSVFADCGNDERDAS